ncbi:MAG TPA: LytR C-terminal domain-containing protein [Solirubrobacteraceae bacterium]|jgi:hypothetical protein
MALVLALSLTGSVHQLSVIVSIAALVGVAVLSLLAFAQARELKRLRDWASSAGERTDALERAVAQARLARSADVPRQPAAQGRAVTPRTTPVVARPVAATTAMAAATAATQLAPAASALASAAPTAVGTAVAGLPVAGELAKPVVQADQIPPPQQATEASSSSSSPAPALAGAIAAGPATDVASVTGTNVAGVAAAGAGLAAAESAGATITTPGEARNGQPPNAPERRSPEPEGLPGDSQPRPSLPPAPAGGPRTVAAATPRPAPRGSTQTPRSAARQSDGAAAVGPPRAAGGATGGRGRGRGDTDRKATIYRRERSSTRTIALIAGGVIAVAVAVVVVLSLTSGGGAKRQAARGGTAPHHGAVAQSHRSLHVVVLNATETDGLAAKVANTLKGSGYKHAAALFGTPAGSYPATVIEYRRGRKAAASEVAKVLHVASGNVQPLASTTAPLAAGAPLVVIVGGPTGEAATSEGEVAEEEEASAGGEISEP